MFERDRPLFKQFIPVLKAINAAGWQPLTLANASDSTPTTLPASPASAANASGGRPVSLDGGVDAARFSIERFGSVAQGSIFWTLRRIEPLHATATVAVEQLEPPLPRPVTLSPHTQSLGLAPRAEGYAVAEIAQRGSRRVVIAPVVVRAGAVMADVHIGSLPHNTTLVLQLKV